MKRLSKSLTQWKKKTRLGEAYCEWPVLFHVVVEASGDRNKERKIRRKKKKPLARKHCSLTRLRNWCALLYMQWRGVECRFEVLKRPPWTVEPAEFPEVSEFPETPSKEKGGLIGQRLWEESPSEGARWEQTEKATAWKYGLGYMRVTPLLTAAVGFYKFFISLLSLIYQTRFRKWK